MIPPKSGHWTEGGYPQQPTPPGKVDVKYIATISTSTLTAIAPGTDMDLHRMILWALRNRGAAKVLVDMYLKLQND